jgi:hypothetical protein
MIACYISFYLNQSKIGNNNRIELKKENPDMTFIYQEN